MNDIAPKLNPALAPLPSILTTTTSLIAQHPAPTHAPPPSSPPIPTDLDAQKLALIEQIKKSSSIDQLKSVMATNALASSTPGQVSE